jgi:hypothetical protein
MRKQPIALRHMALAAIAAAALALPATSAVRAQQGSGTPAKSHHARIVHHRLYNAVRPNPSFAPGYYNSSAGFPRGYYGDPWAPNFERPFPQGNPNYSGSNGP